ncbi:MAG: hypothetical protein IPL40_16605 [Proteobacteria bacterium]|nr:hypothetical protein [Pseudomonadota bacterium]
MLPPVNASGPFRGLAPFNEADQAQFFGRDTERGRLQQWLRRERPPMALVTGEAGAGKTSLLRAALIPAARAAHFLPLYFEVGEGWHGALRAALGEQLGRPLGPEDDTARVCLDLAAAAPGRVLVIADQLEQALWIEGIALDELNRLLAALTEVSAPALHLVLGVERRELHVIGQLALPRPRIADEARIEVGRFDRHQTAFLIERSVLVGGAYMEAGLPDLIAEELCTPGPVLPAQLQCVLQAVMLRRNNTLAAYRRGGDAGVLSVLHVELLAARAGGWRARRVLAALAEPENPRGLLTTEEVSQRAGMIVPAVEQTLEGLANAGLVRHGAPRHDGQAAFGVLHPYLLPGIRDLVAPVRRGRAHARLTLRRRADRHSLLRPHELLAIWRYWGTALPAKEQQTVRRGLRTWTAGAALFLLLGVLVAGSIWWRLAHSSYLAELRGVGGPARVVLRSGDPGLRFAFRWGPGRLGAITDDTGFALDTLPRAAQRAVRGQSVVRSASRRAGGTEPWFDRLLGPLPLARRGTLLVLAGERARGGRLLVEAGRHPDQRSRAAQALALLLPDSSAAREVLLSCLGDERARLRRLAVRLASRLPAAAAAEVLERGAHDADAQVRLLALAGLSRVPRARALRALETLIIDTDRRVQQQALTQLERAASTDAAAALEIVVQAQARLVAAGAPATAPPARALPLLRLQQRLLQRAPGELAKHLIRQLGQTKDVARQARRLALLLPLAEQLDASAKPVLERLQRAESALVRANATALLARLGGGDAVVDALAALASTRRTASESVALRRAAALGLGWVEAPDRQRRLDLLKRLLTDPEASVAAAAVSSLLRLGYLGTQEVVRQIRRGYAAAAEGAREVICDGEVRDRFALTALVSAIWASDRPAQRRGLLSCVEAIASAQAPLGQWLAQRAAADRASEVQRAGALALAVALQQGGARLESLARSYLATDDATGRIALLQAIAARPPQRSALLFKAVAACSNAAEVAVRAAIAPAAIAVAPSPLEAAALLERLIRDPATEVQAEALHAALRLEAPAAGPQSERWRLLAERLDAAVAQALATAHGAAAQDAAALAVKLRLERAVDGAAGHLEAEVRAITLPRLVSRAAPSTALALLEDARRAAAPSLRLAALRLLGEESPRLGKLVVPLLARGLRAADPSEREAAFTALGLLRGEATDEALRLLRVAVGDRSEERRRLAFTALGALASSRPEAATALIEGALDPAHDVQRAARTALARHLARSCPPARLWQLLRDSRRDSLLRWVSTVALAWYGRGHGDAWLQAAWSKLPPTSPTSIRIAAHLAVALGRSHEAPPERTLAWLVGW